MFEIMMLFQCKGVARKVPGKTHRERREQRQRNENEGNREERAEQNG